MGAAAFEKLVDSGVDFSGRIVYITGEIEEDGAAKIVAAIRMLDRTSGEIEVWLCSGGGDVGWGFAIYDAIRSCKNWVTVKGVGRVESMASCILQAGDRRVLANSAVLMVHNGSVSFEAEAEKVRSHVRDAEICDNRYREILSKRSGIPLPKIRALCRREAFLTAAEAVELGLADELEYRD